MNDRLKQNPGYYCQTNSLITQRLEYHAFNMGVPGSNPGGGTKCRSGEMVDTLHLGCSTSKCVGSSPTFGTKHP